jgi:VIT1/CCC1 family predicted Fe2+/Mn2+ transporter
VVETLARLASAGFASAQAVVRPLAPFQPFAHALLATIAAAMVGITTFVVGRDVSGRGAPQEHA